MTNVPQDGSPLAEETQAQRALRFSELSYRRLFQAAQDGILILDVETGRITDANPFIEKLLGFSHEEMVGRTVGDLSPFKDIVSNQAMLERLQEQGYVRYEDLPLETRDGRHIAVEFVSNVYQAGDQRVIQCNIRDITQRKKAEADLSRLAALVESSDDAIIGKDLHGVVTSWNRGAEKIFGYGAQEMVGTSITRLIPEDRLREESLILEKIGHGESMDHFETKRLTKDGRLIDVSVTVSPIRDGSGKPVGISKVARDVTEQMQADRLHLWKSALLEAQLDSSIDGILVVDADSRQILQNRQMAGLWKLPGRIVDDRDEAAQLAFAATRTKNPAQFLERVAFLYAHPDEIGHDEIELVDGTLLDRYSAPVRDKAGKHYGRIWSFRDITERRQMEARLLQAQKMESIGQMAGGIAHDFNNILTAIVGNTDMLRGEVSEGSPAAEYLDEITKATRRATDLVSQILTFSRQGKQERSPIRLNDVVLEALKLLRASLPATIRIQTELTDTPAVLANATSVHQVIMNLGTNAWHAMRGQPGTLKVEMGVIEVDADFVRTHPELVPGRFVRLSVGDTGCGMDRATVERIFDPFFTTKGVGEGTGLGLAVVHGIMKSHGGGISVYSQPGEGTTFHLYFPVAAAETALVENDAKPIPRGRGERILVVDDEESLADLTKKILERLGYVVTAKVSALEALSALRDRPDDFDLVVTDLTMPAMDGATLGGQMLLIRPDLPIILTSGYSGIMTEKTLRELGFRELVQKPSTARALGEAVHRVLSAQHLARPKG